VEAYLPVTTKHGYENKIEQNYNNIYENESQSLLPGMSSCSYTGIDRGISVS
jgi:hypothetical protein